MTSAGTPAAVEEWEARAEHDIGVLILLYLADHPRPVRSVGADCWEEWARGLVERGQSRLEASGGRHLQPIPAGA